MAANVEGVESNESTPTGYNLEEMSHEARLIFLTVLGRDNVEADTRQQGQWAEFADRVMMPVLQRQETTFSSLTREATAVFHSPEKFDSLPVGLQLAFEAAARHVACLAQAEDEEDLRMLQNFDWRKWAALKMSGETTGPPEDDAGEDEEDFPLNRRDESEEFFYGEEDE